MCTTNACTCTFTAVVSLLCAISSILSESELLYTEVRKEKHGWRQRMAMHALCAHGKVKSTRRDADPERWNVQGEGDEMCSSMTSLCTAALLKLYCTLLDSVYMFACVSCFSQWWTQTERNSISLWLWKRNSRSPVTIEMDFSKQRRTFYHGDGAGIAMPSSSFAIHVLRVHMIHVARTIATIIVTVETFAGRLKVSTIQNFAWWTSPRPPCTYWFFPCLSLSVSFIYFYRLVNMHRCNPDVLVLVVHTSM